MDYIEIKLPMSFSPTPDGVVDFLHSDDLLLLQILLIEEEMEKAPWLSEYEHLKANHRGKDLCKVIGQKLLFGYELTDGESRVAAEILLNGGPEKAMRGRPATGGNLQIWLLVSLCVAYGLKPFRNDETAPGNCACDVVAAGYQRIGRHPMTYSGVKNSYLRAKAKMAK